MKLDADGNVHILTLDEDHQKLSPDTVAAWNAVLSEVEATEGPAALVITGEGKTFHQGLDLDVVLGLGEGFTPFIKTVHALFGRLLALELPTASAIQGHAIAGGAMIAQCADLRIMRADRGWFRTPEVELLMPFTIVMNDLLSARLPQPARHQLMVGAARMSGQDAAAAGVVDQAVEGAEAVLDATVRAMAERVAHRGPVVAAIRRGLYPSLFAALDVDADRADVMVR